MKTPKFWAKKNLYAIALLPLSVVYFVAMLLDRLFTRTCQISKPVICIGNLTAGGSGKTPTAIAIGKILHEMMAEKNLGFAYLSSGYKGQGAEFVSLNQGTYSPKTVGDEPLLLNEVAPTFVAKNRLFGAKEIDKLDDVNAIVLDDGMQNKSLHKDLTIAVIDGKVAFGNGFLIPAGPMRQPLKMGLKDPDFIVMVGDAPQWLLDKLKGIKVTKAKISAQNMHQFHDQKLIAFCGLAYPGKFFSFLKTSYLDVIEEKSFLDHYDYQISDLKKLCDRAEKKGAKLITTKKDWIKFPNEYKRKIDYLDIELEFLDKEFIKSELKKIIKK